MYYTYWHMDRTQGVAITIITISSLSSRMAGPCPVSSGHSEGMAAYMACHVLPTVTRSNLCPRPRFSLPDPPSLFSRSLPGPSLTLSSLWSPCVAMPSLFQAAGWHCCEVWRILLGALRPGKLMMGDHRDPPSVPSKPSMVSWRHMLRYLATTKPSHPSI